MNNDSNVGIEIVFLMKQQRNLYHQLRVLAEKQAKLSPNDPPETTLRTVASRRKLIQKLQSLDEKIRPIKSNWDKIRSRIKPKYETQARQVAAEIKQMRADMPAEIINTLSLDEAETLAELFATEKP